MINVLTIFFLIVRIISNPIANVFQKKLSTNISSLVINFYTYLFLSIISSFLIFSQDISNILNLEFISLVIIAGFLCALGTICLIKAINIGELSVIGPINSYKSVIGLISAIFLLKEIPSCLSLIGIFLIILGSKYIFETTTTGFSLNLLKRKDIQYRLLALLLTGIEASILKKIIILSSVEICFSFWCFTGLFWSLIFIIIFKKNIVIKQNQYLMNILLISLCLGLMQYSTNYVFEKMNVGYALALFQLSSLVTVFLGYKVFKEENLIKKIFASIIMIIGSILIILN
ncbi:MAG: DMT family transporter [Candidatus Gastranaerophilales bacterium]|nr:DMT family transporter [Candidatus Gastranaerophilales bacterium]